jgi:excinuclease ABC subunit B
MFKLNLKYQPAGDQPEAIKKLCKGILEGQRDQVLLGATGTGKTFTMANVIQNLNRPALIMAHNKTLAAQLYGEFKEFFPENAVEYFVSYYDYYQPEAYIAKTDTYIEKDSAINEQIDLMRHSATRSVLERSDTIIISSVSAIYGLGDVGNYSHMKSIIKKKQVINMDKLLTEFIAMQYERNDVNFTRTSFRVRGDIVDIFPSHLEDKAWRFEFFGDEIERIIEFDPLTGRKIIEHDYVVVYPAKHFVTPENILVKAIEQIKIDLELQVKDFEQKGMLVEAQRLEQRTKYDIELMLSTGMCKGIENYSRYLDGRAPGDPPYTLFDYLPKDAIIFVDESHISVPQIGAMYEGDKSRKSSLVNYGFRLTSALDNRPLKFEEWDRRRNQTVYVSATPAEFELNKTQGEIVEQIIRPTGLLDPICEIRSAEFQVDDLVNECRKLKEQNLRVLALTLTKKMAEQLNTYLNDIGVKSCYLHSDIDTIERIEVINKLRSGEIDVIVGINLLREGIDIPECGLVAILDADKEGFLRNNSSLIQMIGRAARNSNGRVILYADKHTKSINYAIDETNRRRKIQEDYNIEHVITPKTIIKKIRTIFDVAFGDKQEEADKIITSIHDMDDRQLAMRLKVLKKKMKEHAANLEFEEAMSCRNEIKAIEKVMI